MNMVIYATTVESRLYYRTMYLMHIQMGSENGWIYSYNKDGRITKELRPVFYEELELLGFKNKGWKYQATEKPCYLG